MRDVKEPSALNLGHTQGIRQDRPSITCPFPHVSLEIWSEFCSASAELAAAVATEYVSEHEAAP